mmetsp:Transcript_21343/g.51593  ORF Transcript_21343/g.51593 Transcript_21343/m.51593 type:complete len:207 (+) Transcript_21343:1137-1757(+)
MPLPPMQQQRGLRGRIVRICHQILPRHVIQQVLDLARELPDRATPRGLPHPLVVSRKAFEELRHGVRAGERAVPRVLHVQSLLRAIHLLRLDLRHELLDLALGDGGVSRGRQTQPELVAIVVHEFELEGAHLDEGLRVSVLGFEYAKAAGAGLGVAGIEVQNGVAVRKGEVGEGRLFVHGRSIVRQRDDLARERRGRFGGLAVGCR